MNRPLTQLLGPEAVLVMFTGLLFWFCARHNSGEGRDLALIVGAFLLAFYVEVFKR